MSSDFVFDYSAEALAFDFAGQVGATVPSPPEGHALERLAGRVRTAWERSGLARLTLLGLGSGALAGTLAGTLPAGALCVVEPDPALARALKSIGRLDWWRRGGAACLVADNSPWAALALLERSGRGPGRALVLANPELSPEAKRGLRPVELLLTRSKPLEMPERTQPPRLPKLTVAAILAPSEPDLPEFFAQFPPWISELALVWDAPELPDNVVPGTIQVRQTARPLAHDFSAQRNAMLSLCSGDWVLYLDADERISPDGWGAIPRLVALAEQEGLGGWRLPRVSPYPTPERALMGFGLWPDVQLRLFRNQSGQSGQAGLRFENPVHERLTGLIGGQGLALELEIEHVSRLRKGRAELERKLRGFDEAGSGRVRHALSAEYPSVARRVVSGGPVRPLLLPPELA